MTLLRTIGAMVYTIGTVRRRGDYQGTMQSPGLPDLLVFLPGVDQDGRRVYGLLTFIEVKAPDGRLSAAQQTFRATCAEAGIAHVVGGAEAVVEWLKARGYVR